MWNAVKKAFGVAPNSPVVSTTTKTVKPAVAKPAPNDISGSAQRKRMDDAIKASGG